MTKTSCNRQYWENRYHKKQTLWDTGSITPPLQNYINQLVDKQLEILIPGAGNSYEAEYLYERGFTNVYVVDIAAQPLQNLASRCPSFPREQLLQQDFFALDQPFDLILEQTFFCSFEPEHRQAYARKCSELLRPAGKLAGVLFDCAFAGEGPPFGGSRQEYRDYFAPYFEFKHWELCYNSIQPRAGRELFMCLERQS
jgi:SAM-dependent methyltransferase